jgi:phage gp16-like protein
MATAQQIKKIHILKSALKIDDDTYRATLTGYGAKSSKDRGFTIGKADEMIQDLVEKAVAAGVWETRKPARKAKTTRRLADDPQSKMIRAYWIQLHQAGKVTNPAESALCAFVKRMTRKDALDWLNDRDVTVVKKALKDWLER